MNELMQRVMKYYLNQNRLSLAACYRLACADGVTDRASTPSLPQVRRWLKKNVSPETISKMRDWQADHRDLDRSGFKFKPIAKVVERAGGVPQL